VVSGFPGFPGVDRSFFFVYFCCLMGLFKSFFDPPSGQSCKFFYPPKKPPVTGCFVLLSFGVPWSLTLTFRFVFLTLLRCASLSSHLPFSDPSMVSLALRSRPTWLVGKFLVSLPVFPVTPNTRRPPPPVRPPPLVKLWEVPFPLFRCFLFLFAFVPGPHPCCAFPGPYSPALGRSPVVHLGFLVFFEFLTHFP